MVQVPVWRKRSMAGVPGDLEKKRRGRCRFDGRCGNCRGGVGAPAAIAEGDGAIGGAGGEHELDPAVGLPALDEGVAEEDDAVAVAKFQRGAGVAARTLKILAKA